MRRVGENQKKEDDGHHGNDEFPEQPQPAEEGTALSVVDDDHGQPFPALQILRESRRYSPVALGVGVFARAVVTLCTTIEDTASIADLFLTYTRFFLVFILLLMIFFGVGSTAVTWGFWTPQVQEYTGDAIDWVRARCRLTRIAEADESDAEFEEEPGCLETVQESTPWLTYVTISCSAATLGLTANENVEGTRMILGWASTTWGLAIFGLLLGVIATVYSGFTDLDSLWQVRRANQNGLIPRRPPTTLVFIVTALGTLELFYRTWIVIYLTALEITDNRIGSLFLASFFTVSGTIQNFFFQTSYALEGSSFLRSVRLVLLRMSVPVKVVFFALIGLTTIIVNMSMPTFNISTILPAIFNEHLGIALSPHLVMGIAIATAAGITIGDLLSSFWGGVVRQTWHHPDNLLLHYQRSRPYYMGFFDRRQAQQPRLPNSDRVSVLEDDEAVELQQREPTGVTPPQPEEKDFGEDYDFK